ncbi:MAG TPA: zf-HC2 domain-containing protein [Candidatus Hydrogenedentes bacterium]|nr:zf-HC2 domain-containing protein [Candidatus Hydrogenedentota bacterium]
MECNDVIKRLVDWMDGGLPPRMQREIGEHLEQCYLCAEEAKMLASLEEMCRDALRCPEARNRFEALRPHLRTPHVIMPPPRYGLREALTGLLAASVVIAFGWLLAPYVQSGVHFARLPERARTPDFEKLLDNEIAKDSPKGPIMTLLAWAREIQRVDPLAFGDGHFTQDAPSAEAPDDSRDKPVSMRPHERPRLLLADKNAPSA